MQSRCAKSAALALVGLGFLAAFQTPSVALPAVQDVLGVYNGFSRSLLPFAEQDPVRITIDQQRGRNLVGSISGPGLLLPAVHEVRGTIGPRGTVSLTGRSGNPRFGDGSVRVFCDGSVRVFGDGSVRLQMVYMVLRQRQDAAGRLAPWQVVLGQLVVLRDSGLTDLPAVQGTWNGRYTPNPGPPDSEPGPLTLDILYQAGSFVRGQLIPGGTAGLLPARPFDVVGDIGTPNAETGEAPFNLVGLGEAGWFFAEGTIGYPPNPCVGRYHVLYFDGTWETGTFELTMEPRT